MSKEQLQQLMMAQLDGELDAEGRRRLEQLLAADPDTRREFESMQHLAEVQQKMTLIEPTEQAWRAFERGLVGRLVYRPLHIGGMIAVVVGLLLLGGWGCFELLGALWEDGSAPVVVRIAIAAVVTGSLAVFLSVLIRRFVTLPSDKYHREVEL